MPHLHAPDKHRARRWVQFWLPSGNRPETKVPACVGAAAPLLNMTQGQRFRCCQ